MHLFPTQLTGFMDVGKIGLSDLEMCIWFWDVGFDYFWQSCGSCLPRPNVYKSCYIFGPSS